MDWSASAVPSPRRPSKDAIWIAEADADGVQSWYLRTRAGAMALVADRFHRALAQQVRVLCGFDFPFGYPAGFGVGLTGGASALAVWTHLAGMVEDRDDNRNNRFQVAAALNARFPGIGPFWGCPTSVALDGLPAKGTLRSGHGLPERRAVELRVPRAQSCWKLYTTGSVGSQARLQGLCRQFAGHLSVWPFEAADRPIVLSEVYPSLLNGLVQATLARDPSAIKDEVQVRLLAATLAEMSRRGTLAAALAAPLGGDLADEGWILGVGCGSAMQDAAAAIYPAMSPDSPGMRSG